MQINRSSLAHPLHRPLIHPLHLLEIKEQPPLCQLIRLQLLYFDLLVLVLADAVELLAGDVLGEGVETLDFHELHLGYDQLVAAVADFAEFLV